MLFQLYKVFGAGIRNVEVFGNKFRSPLMPGFKKFFKAPGFIGSIDKSEYAAAGVIDDDDPQVRAEIMIHQGIGIVQKSEVSSNQSGEPGRYITGSCRS